MSNDGEVLHVTLHIKTLSGTVEHPDGGTAIVRLPSNLRLIELHIVICVSQ